MEGYSQSLGLGLYPVPSTRPSSSPGTVPGTRLILSSLPATEWRGKGSNFSVEAMCATFQRLCHKSHIITAKLYLHCYDVGAFGCCVLFV